VLTIIAVVLALTVIPSPWGVVTVLGAFAIDVAETVFFVRWSKRRRAAVGVETLVGRSGVVVRALTPRGQVKVDGEVWEARAAYDLLPGDEVVVARIDGLVLDVEPTPTDNPTERLPPREPA
jgi:membrane-bound serine protease (ClpP class)